jgi:hypothetical protein
MLTCYYSLGCGIPRAGSTLICSPRIRKLAAFLPSHPKFSSDDCLLVSAARLTRSDSFARTLSCWFMYRLILGALPSPHSGDAH